MTVSLDTNSLIRYFTNDDVLKAGMVEKLLNNEKKIAIAEVVFPELEYILVKQYKHPRKNLIQAYTFLNGLTNVFLSQQIRTAITIFEETKLDMADCIIAAHSLKGTLASFDKELLSVDKVKNFWD